MAEYIINHFNSNQQILQQLFFDKTSLEFDVNEEQNIFLLDQNIDNLDGYDFSNDYTVTEESLCAVYKEKIQDIQLEAEEKVCT